LPYSAKGAFHIAITIFARLHNLSISSKGATSGGNGSETARPYLSRQLSHIPSHAEIILNRWVYLVYPAMNFVPMLKYIYRDLISRHIILIP
jgi:hypothetical protein